MTSSQRWRWVRVLGCVAVLGAVLDAWGAGPFLDAARGIDLRLLALAVGIAAVTTLCSAWRWSLVATGLRARLSFTTALTGCYRSQLLNSTLPGGVLGDVHRGARHGPVDGGAGMGLRTVWWERTAGQVVQVVVTVVVLLVVPSPVRPSRAVVLTSLMVLVVLGVALLRVRGGSSRLGTAVRAVVTDVRCGVLGSAIWPGVLLTSVVVVAGHWLTFVLAVRAAGAALPLGTLVPLGLLVLVASGLPINVAGWGPREGAAAWLFGAVGAGASTGVAAAAIYGVLALVATAPGLLVLGGDAVRAGRSGARREPRPAGGAGAGHRVGTPRLQARRASPGSHPRGGGRQVPTRPPARPVSGRVRAGGGPRG